MENKAKKISEEIFYSTQAIPLLSQEEILFIREEASSNPRKRSRICTHPDPENFLHEMFITQKKGNYIPPHKHLNKAESFHLIQGAADVVIFNEKGDITEVIQMGDYSSGKQFYYRISDAIYHSMIILSDYLVYHEVTTGPFLRKDTVFAPWAPDEGNKKEADRYMKQVAKKIQKYKKI